MNVVPVAFPIEGLSPSKASDAITRTEVAVAAGLLLSCATLMTIALVGPSGLIEWLASEDGPIEGLAVFAWLLLAGAIAAVSRLNRHGVSLSLICIVFALRELDGHKVIVNASFLKRAFYLGSDVPPEQQALGAALALGTLGLLAWGLILNGGAFMRLRLHWRAWGRLVIGALMLLVIAKVLDRLPVLLALDGRIAYSVVLMEEWLESYAPCLLLLATWGAHKPHALTRATPCRVGERGVG